MFQNYEQKRKEKEKQMFHFSCFICHVERKVDRQYMLFNILGVLLSYIIPMYIFYGWYAAQQAEHLYLAVYQRLTTYDPS